MNLLRFLPWCKVSLPSAGLTVEEAATTILDEAAVADDQPLACGWFDSSHELQAGLSVREDLGADALAAEMPLASWLEWHLQRWCPAPAAV